ncbi:MAG: hypothetical protein K0S47_2581 [Herbinix sp.]|jgi:hypothetical protein|nr:hypothetical protein [Herbinix sp.]
MKAAIKYILMVLVTVNISLLCLFLPARFASWKDQQTIGEVSLETIEETNIDFYQEMTIFDKLSIYLNPTSFSNIIENDQSKFELKDQVINKLIDELEKLQELGIISLEKEDLDDNKNLVDIQMKFVVSSDDPSKSMIVWDITFLDKNNYINVQMDDDTGMILSLASKRVAQSAEASNYNTLITNIGTYYGFTKATYKELTDAFPLPTYYSKGIPVVYEDGQNKLSVILYLYDKSFYMILNEKKYNDK